MLKIRTKYHIPDLLPLVAVKQVPELAQGQSQVLQQEPTLEL
jgi:hypothetical protein